MNPVVKEGATGSCDLVPTTEEVSKLKKDMKKLTEIIENNADNIEEMEEEMK
jgi:hypothetical protein